MKKKEKELQSGLSLLETLVSIAILIVGLMGGLILTSFSISTMTYTRHYHEAEQLSQEAIEVARATRDSNWLNSKQWDFQFGSGPFVVNFNQADKKTELATIQASKVIDFTSDNTISQTLFLETKVYDVNANPALPFFTQDSAFNQASYQTPYHRQLVLLSDENNPPRRTLRASVVFPYRSGYKAVHLEEILYDWK